MNISKTLFHYVLLLSGLLVVLGITYMERSGDFISTDNLTYIIQEDYKKSEELIKDYMSDNKSSIDIESLQHQLYIYQNDSLVAWNTVYNHTDPQHRYREIADQTIGDYRYRILTPSKSTLSSLLNSKGQISDDSSNHHVVNLCTLICYFIFILLCYQYFYEYYRNDGTNVLLMANGLVWFFSMLGLLNYPFLEASIPLYTGQLNILHVLLSSTYLYYHTRYIEANYKNKTINSWRIAVVVASIGFLLIGLSVSIKLFIYNTTLYELDTIAIQYSLLGVLFLAVIVISTLAIFYYSVEVLSHVKTSNAKSKYLFGLLGVFISVILSTQLEEFPWIPYSGFLIAFLLMLDISIESKRKKIIFTFWWMLVFSGALSLITYFYILKKDINDRKNYIEQVYFKKDEAIKKISIEIDSILRNSDVFQPIAELPVLATVEEPDYIDFIKQVLIENGFTRDHKINLGISGYDIYGKSIFSNSQSNFSEIKKVLNNSDRENESLFYSPYTGKYYLRYSIDNQNYDDALHLYISVVDRRKHKKSISDFNYVILNDTEVIKSELANTDIVPLSKLYHIEETKFLGDYSYVVSRPNAEVKIVSYKRSAGIMKPISLFSFILTLSGVIIFFLYIVNSYLPFLPSKITINLNRRASLRNKIQLTIVLLVVFSFIIIGLITTYYFRNVLDKNQIIQDQRETVTILNNIKSAVNGAKQNGEARFILENSINKIADNHGANVAVYDTQGRIMTSSEEQTDFERIPMTALSTILDNETAEIIRNKRTHTLIPLYNNAAQPYATLSIVHTHELTMNNSIIDFLSTILNVYVFLFLTASALAIAISNSITRPLSILADKLREFKLGKRNEKLVWNSSDEIGALINDYNNLTQELQNSADIIAKTQRDMAWREMAKQVAHEIKNPLTPMKLSIQYLQRVIKEEPSRAPELIPRVSETLVEQINNLNQIANEFSNFAKMPKAENKRVVLNDIVESIHDLFRKRDDLEIHLSIPIDNITVYADRNHLVRILNNIVKNAIQAIPTDRKGIININLYVKGKNALISVKDNGSGISDDMKSRVFEPNFTTKSSGTGLGLAISANMLDSFNGKIWFETEVGVGTIFYIEIPLMLNDENIIRHSVILE